MSFLEGTIEIPLEEFWRFVYKYDPTKESGMETVYGVPRVNEYGDIMEIDFAAASEGSPNDWSEKPRCTLQWINHKNKNKENAA